MQYATPTKHQIVRAGFHVRKLLTLSQKENASLVILASIASAKLCEVVGAT